MRLILIDRAVLLVRAPIAKPGLGLLRTAISPMTPTSPWWSPDRHADRRAFLIARNRIKEAVRGWFLDQDFVEVDPGCLQISPGNEAHLHAFQTDLIAPDRSKHRMYLHTSPEFACKKLIAAGERRLFTFAPVFRNCERGPLHAPEFTMLEWYRAGEADDEQYPAIQQDCSDLLRLAFETSGQGECRWKSRRGTADGEALYRQVPAIIEELMGVDLLATIGEDGVPNRDLLAGAAELRGVHISPDESWGDIFSKLMVEVEARYSEVADLCGPDGRERTLLLDCYPSVMSPLARPDEINQRLAKRFEVFMCGIELANGFGESTNSAQVCTALKEQMAIKKEIYGEQYPIDEEFIRALSVMPPKTAGCAMGFDRLVMLATGATHIDQVLWTPISQ